MFPFWEMVIAPVVKATGARRVLEIGALRGETTSLMFDQLGPESELHVIDPLPQFDPDEHEREFPGRYIFHRDLSLNVLPDLPPVDVALIDGDHNWYTVYHELQLLHASARAADQLLPVLVLHDVGWPYGHRDLYYEPSQIPEEFRQPYEYSGMAPGFIRLLAKGGLNAELANAVAGGGPRNGVNRALEDFLEELDRPFRKVVLPIYFGLAIVVEQARLDANPELKAFLDKLESSQFRYSLLRLSEKIRLEAAVHEHNWNRVLEGEIRDNRSRYLELLKAALLDEHYLENEVRLEYLASLGPGVAPDPALLRDPARGLPIRFDRLQRERDAGRSIDGLQNFSHFPYTDMGRAALGHLESVLQRLKDGTVIGDVAFVGVGRGGGAIFARGCMEAWGVRDRTVWVADRFLVSDPDADLTGLDLLSRLARYHADLNQVRDGFARFDLLDERVRFVAGDYRAALLDAPVGKLSVLRLGPGLGDDLEHVLDVMVPKVTPGGTVIVEGVGEPQAEKALREALVRLGSTVTLERIDWNTVSWEVGEPAVAPAVAAPESTLHRVMVPERVEGERVDLSVVVVFYNMQREAKRTLQSLSRSYQRDIDGRTFEVLAIDNGSAPDQKLTAEFVESFGPEFRLVDLGDDATSSPTTALNIGVRMARGRAVALMIDGAHVVTPGVFGLGLKALETYEPALVAVQQWYVGPGQQGDAQQAGYDQQVEDRLFNRITWPVDGYRLFEVSHFIGDRDWFDGMVESNCLIVPRELLEQVGAFDDSFDMPGGGYANLELFERLGAHPGINAVSLLGEGSFHQFHGGTTTNVADEAVRRDRVVSYGTHFAEVRGRGLLGLNTPVNYLGAMATKAARRTRSRRELTLAFAADRDPVTTTSPEPQPVPDEVKIAAIEAIWGNQSWRGATWLGRPVNRYPTDLHSYQELVSQARPETVVLIATDEGVHGRAAFFASIADQLGQGRVVVVGEAPVEGRVEHERVTYVDGAADDPAALDTVRELVGDGGATLFVGLGSPLRIVGVVEAYAPLVPVGGYVVVENTVVNGRPAESGFGPGPYEAVVELLNRHKEFVPDVAFERYTLTFNRNGYLRRMAPT